MAKKEIIINAKILFNGKNKKFENRTIVVKENKIVDIINKKIKGQYQGYVTPAFIDAHSHIGMDREGEPWTESETNDTINQFLPINDPVDSIYFDDRAFKDAVDFGVLYSCVIPGSGNLLGGRAKIIRNWVKYRNEAVIKNYGYKMALGFNPRSTTDWKGERPNTRMGIYGMLEKKFSSVKDKLEKEELKKEKSLFELEKNNKEKKFSKADIEFEKKIINRIFELEFNLEEKAILELMKGEKIAKVHVHKEDDILFLIEFAKKFNLKVTADHTCDVFHKEIFDELGKNNIPIVYGPLGCVGYKVELKHAYYQNAGLLMKSKAFYGLMTDHPVIWSPHLRDSLKFFLINGMKDEEAISLITLKNAKILGIDDKLGSIETGKLASLVVWNNNPLHIGSFPTLVLGEGKILRKV